MPGLASVALLESQDPTSMDCHRPAAPRWTGLLTAANFSILEFYGLCADAELPPCHLHSHGPSAVLGG
jgi:hypothetical protein